jgi:hypothetical protein
MSSAVDDGNNNNDYDAMKIIQQKQQKMLALLKSPSLDHSNNSNGKSSLTSNKKMKQ